METETWHLHPALDARVVGLRPPRGALSAFARVPLVLGRADRPARLEARVIETGSAGLTATGRVLAAPAWEAMLASGEAVALAPIPAARGASGWVLGPALGSLVAEARARLAAGDALLGWVPDAAGAGAVALVIDALARRTRAGLAVRARDRAWLAWGRGDRAAFCALAASAAALEEPASAGSVGLAVAAYRAAGREPESLALALGAARAQGTVFANDALGAADAFGADLGLPRA